MPVISLEESAYTGPIPDDEILPVKVVAVKQTIAPWKGSGGEDIPRFEFSFVVDDPGGAHDGTRLRQDTSTIFSTNPNCVLRNWAQEILGHELVPPFDLDTDDLIGNRCRVVIGHRDYERDGEQRTVNTIKDVFRAKDGNAYAAAVDQSEPF